MPKKSRIGLSKFRLDGKDHKFVWSRTAEAAAKKLYRAHKAEFATAGKLTIVYESGAKETFDVSAWCQQGSNKFRSKPKAAREAENKPDE